MKIRTLLILLVLTAASGCEGKGPIAGPTPPTAPSTPAAPAPGGNVPAPTGTVFVEGRVIDGDREVPVPGAVVTAREFCAPGACRSADLAASGRTDAQGVFHLTTNLPSSWTLLLVDVTRDGYELTRIYIKSAAATTAVLTLLPTLTIRAGESIETRVFLGTYFCGDESHTCRRFFVESPSGEALDLEVIPGDGQVHLGLMVGPEATHPISPNPPRRVTVSGGEVWIYGGVGRLTLTARRR